MAKNKKQRDPIPAEFNSIAELQEFWDTHSLADYEDQLTDVEFEVDLKGRTNLVAVEPTLMKELVARAHRQGISTETLVNLWLSKQLQQV